KHHNLLSTSVTLIISSRIILHGSHSPWKSGIIKERLGRGTGIMSYQALYRVWRPRNFEVVVGQSHITRTLQNAIAHEKFSHAYLFSGPRGTGKTSAAKIFAKTIKCEHAPVKETSNECTACRGIKHSSISDMIEIDSD